MNATLYVYLPSIHGDFAFPRRGDDGSVVVNADKIFDTLNAAFMGSLEAQRGPWGVLTDFIYLDVSGSTSGTRDFAIGGHDVPGSVTGDFDLKLKGRAWTLAGEYLLRSDPQLTMHALLGARLLDVKPRLQWTLSGSLASLPVASRGGDVEISAKNWDAIVGVKGRYALGDGTAWSMPFYADIGTGDSKVTYQAALGVAYSFAWGDVAGSWRYLGYEMKSGQAVHDVKFNGPMVGVTFKW